MCSATHLMRSQNQQHATPHPVGRVDMPGLLYGSVGLALSLALHWMGVLKRADVYLMELLHQPLFRGGNPNLPSMALLILLTAVFCYGVAFAVLDSPEVWRRVLLGVTAIVLSLAMIPAFAVWNIYFSPFIQIVGVFWSWFCVMVYTQHHSMPCDGRPFELRITDPEPELLEPLREVPKKSVVAKKKTAKKKKKLEDKYKPKES